jgi:hypothetical protein
MHSPGPAVREFSLIAAALLIAAAAAEALLRAFSPLPLMSPAYTDRFGDPAFMANSQIKTSTEDFDVTYHTNRLGFRGRNYELMKKPGTYRIVALGNCLTFGLGVDDLDAFPAQLEKRLNSDSLRLKFEVMNLSPIGGSLGSQEFLYRAVGRRYHPDLVISHIFFGNALNYQYVTKKDLVPYDEHRLRADRMHRLVRFIPGYAFLCEHSHLWALLRLQLQSEQDVLHAQRWADASAGKDSADLQRTGIATFDALAQRVCSDGARLLVLKQRGALGSYPLFDDYLRRKTEADPCFLALDLDMGPQDQISGQDWHWNRQGHATVAGRLLGLLKRTLLRGELRP